MNQALDEQDSFRKYLLHELEGEEQERLEERLLTDKEFGRRLAMAQDDLVDDFVAGHLSEREADDFRAHFLTTPARLQKLKFAMALDKYVTVEAPAAAGAGAFEKVLAFFRARPLRAAASVTVLALVLGAALFVVLRPSLFRTGRDYEIGQEFARVNRGQEIGSVPLAELRRGSASTPFLSLSQNLVREDPEQRTVEITRGVTHVRLLLEVTSGSYEHFRAVLQTAGGDDIAAVEDLSAKSEDGAQFVLVNVPPALGRGDFQLRLFGIAGDGRAVDLGPYPFRLTTR